MSAFSRFPWLVASVSRVAEDLAGLPLNLTHGAGADAKPVDQHELLDLLAQPSSWETGEGLRRQLWVDLLLAGNAYVWLLRPAPGRPPASLVRLHPECVSVVAGHLGQPLRYDLDLDGQQLQLAPEDVLHVRLPSYAKGKASVYGVGGVEPLHLSLTSDYRAQRLAARMTKLGVPDVVISPEEPTQFWDDAMRKAVRERYEAVSQEGGALVTSGRAKVDSINPTLRDMEFGKLLAYNRETAMAVVGTPPVKVGLPTANYATSLQQKRVYWEKLASDCRLLDAALTGLAREYDPALSVSHDLGGVEALQESRTDRLARVGTHIANGMSVPDAYAYEGFDDAPVQEQEAPADEPLVDEDEDEDEETRALALALVTRAPLGWPGDEAGRATLWKGYIEQVHDRAERRLGLATLRALRAQRSRYTLRLVEALEHHGRRAAPDGLARGVLDELLEAVLDDADEAQHVLAALGSPVALSAKEGHRYGARLLDLDLTWNATDAVSDLASGSATHMAATSREAVRTALAQGLDEGLDGEALVKHLRDSPAFGPGRARTAATTMATGAVQQGAHHAYEQAVQQGVKVRLHWLSSRDDHVRDAHVALEDADPVVPGQAFVVPTGEYAGAQALRPGGFGVPALDINCRCTIQPVVED